MSQTRNQTKKLIKFMKEAGCNSLQSDSVNNPPPFHLLSESIEPQLQKQTHMKKRGRPKLIHTETLTHQPQPKKWKKLIKNVTKLEQKANQLYQSMPSENLQLIQKLEPNHTANIQFQKTTESLTHQTEVSPCNSLADIVKEEILIKKQISKYLLPTCLNKSFDRIFGYHGHATVLTTQPIIEGTYYLQLKILPHSINQSNIYWCKIFNHDTQKLLKQLKSAVRVGIAPISYKLLQPLGNKFSYAYKSIDGSLYHESKRIFEQGTKGYSVGDTIGVQLHLEPPSPIDKSEKNRNLNLINFGSRLVFYKNGIKIHQINDLKQQYYVFGVSLYNWSNVEINMGPQFRYKPSSKAKAYCDIFEEPILYKDLKF